MYPDPSSASAALYERARRVLPDGVSRSTILHEPYPVYVRSGSGARVVDVDGNAYLDCNGNYTSLIHGHAHPAVQQAVVRQLERGTAFSLATEAEVHLAELLCGRAASFERIRFTNSGTEAVMNALKAARAFTGRPRIAKCEGAYHGSYDAAEISLDAGPDTWGDVGRPTSVAYSAGTPAQVLDDVVVLPYNHVEETEAILRSQGDQLAAVLLDPLANRIGMIPPTPEYAAMLRRVTRELGSLLVLDEVITFRLDVGGAQTLFGIDPDLTTLGKIIGGGFPVGAVAGRAEVMSVFEAGSSEGGRGKARLPHGGTFNANPVTMAAGLAAMQCFDAAAVARLGALGDQARAALTEVLASVGPGQVTGAGSLFRVHLHDRPLTSYRDSRPNPEEHNQLADLQRALLNEGVVLTPYGMGCLSTAVEGTDVEQLVEAMGRALATVGASA